MAPAGTKVKELPAELSGFSTPGRDSCSTTTPAMLRRLEVLVDNDSAREEF